jgi:hypothetical protein
MLAQFGETEFSNGMEAFGHRLRLAEGPLDLQWHHCSVTAEFLGDFYALRCTATGLDAHDARHSIGYLANELMENAVKFRAPGDILIHSSLEGTRFEIRVVNLIDETTSSRFQPLLTELTSRDAGELLIERIEANAEDASSGGSGLGLLTLMNDYGARLGWTFSRDNPAGAIRLETLAALDLA